MRKQTEPGDQIHTWRKTNLYTRGSMSPKGWTVRWEGRSVGGSGFAAGRSTWGPKPHTLTESLSQSQGDEELLLWNSCYSLIDNKPFEVFTSLAFSVWFFIFYSFLYNYSYREVKTEVPQYLTVAGKTGVIGGQDLVPDQSGGAVAERLWRDSNKCFTER